MCDDTRVAEVLSLFRRRSIPGTTALWLAFGGSGVDRFGGLGGAVFGTALLETVLGVQRSDLKNNKSDKGVT